MPLPNEFFDTIQDEGLRETLRAEPSLSSFNHPAEGLKAFVETKKMVGGMVKLPGPDAKDEDWSNYYSKLRPETPDKYQIQKTEIEGAPWNDNLEKGFRTVAHEIGLHPRQAERLAGWWAETMGGMAGEQKTSIEQGQTELKKIYGADYEKAVDTAQRGLAAVFEKIKAKGYDPSRVQAFLESTGLGNDPAMVLMMNEYAAATAEDQAVTGDRTQQHGAVEDAKTRIAAKLNDGCATKPRNQKCPYHQGDVAEIQKHQADYALVYGEKPVVAAGIGG